jgi:hypothetical protein
MLLLFCASPSPSYGRRAQRIDEAVFSFFNMRSRRRRWLDRAMRTVNRAGPYGRDRRGRRLFIFRIERRRGLCFVLGSAALWLAVELIKHLVRRRVLSAGSKSAGCWKSGQGEILPSGIRARLFLPPPAAPADGRGLPFWLLMYVTALLVGFRGCTWDALSPRRIGRRHPGELSGHRRDDGHGRMLELFVF